MRKEPNAIEPRWNRYTHQRDFATVPYPFSGPLNEKYQRQAEHPMVNWATPMMNEVIQKRPKTSKKNAYRVTGVHLISVRNG